MKLILICCILSMAGCTGNEPFRTSDVVDCRVESICSPGFCEKHNGYDLGFVEYSERGNEFHPDRTEALLKQIELYSESSGVAVFVFIHGWKHNADVEDENVLSFKRALERKSVQKLMGDRKIIGVYVGWRGLSLHGGAIENLTYWDRKDVAEEVGRGGVTELLLRLDAIDKRRKDNFLLVVGHSFGGAITLASLHDIILQRMISGQNGAKPQAFGNGVVLLNPAIEANQAVQLKENSMRLGGSIKDFPTLLYVISTDGDSATHAWFPLGQMIGVNLTWKQVDLKRRFMGKDYFLREREMDTTTVGNFAQFRTGQIYDVNFHESVENNPYNLGDPEIYKFHKTGILSSFSSAEDGFIFGKWIYKSYCGGGSLGDIKEVLPCHDNDPMKVIYTPRSFIKSHNDVFNSNVVSFLKAVVTNSYYDETPGANFGHCEENNNFYFWKCFAVYQEGSYGGVSIPGAPR